MNLMELLEGEDLRSLSKSDQIIPLIKTQKDFDKLFEYLFHNDRLIVMRAADVIEKVSQNHHEYLQVHKDKILKLCKTVVNKELKWHLALLIPRLKLNKPELGKVWDILTNWAQDKVNSRIVRVNSLQALFELIPQSVELQEDFLLTLLELEKEQIPSLSARIRILRKQLIKSR